ncbi:MAG: hydrogenase iron-sulfur subunit, partial [Candidatus Thermoplasmatota archaeon]
YPPNVRIIRTMCSARVSPKFVRHALKRGVAAVLVSGCHLKDCHYITANYNTKRRVEKLWEELKRKGVDPSRVHLEWFTAAEGQKFADEIKKLKTVVATVTPEEIARGQNAYKERLDGR